MAAKGAERWLLLALLAGALVMPAVARAFGEDYLVSSVSRLMIFAIAAVSLDLILGYGGLVSLAHAAFFGIGAYTVAILAFHVQEDVPILGAAGTTQALLTIPLATLASGAVALAIGALSLRTSGVYFIMITLAFGQMLHYLAVSLHRYGGDDGLTMWEANRLGTLDLGRDTTLYYVALAALAAFFVLCRVVVASRFGRALSGIRQNEARMRTLGYGTTAYPARRLHPRGRGRRARRVARRQSREVREPGHDALDPLGRVPVHGDPGRNGHADRRDPRRGGLHDAGGGPAPALRGALLAAPQGPLARRLRAAADRRDAGQPPRSVRCAVRAAAAAVSGPLLQAEGLVRSFGALRASDGLDLSVAAGECHAVIGPNGAGKSTLMKLISGEIPAEAGRIVFEGRDLGHLPAHRRARLGLARSYQITSIFPEMSAAENVALAVQSRAGHSFRFVRRAASDPALSGPVRAALDKIGLADVRDRPAHDLSYGQQRQLEIAMAMALAPKLLLLDEPLAGMGRSESDQVIALLARLKGQVTMLLVEHDMEAVFRLADRVTVLVYGRALATGSPDAIRNDPAVREAYLGLDG